MIHINREVRNHLGTVVGALVDTFFPQMYEAVSIRDFVENRKEVQPTRSIVPPALLYYGEAGISFANVHFRRGENDLHTLYDLTDEIEVQISFMSSLSVVQREGGLDKLVVPDGRLFEAGVFYKPKTDQAFLRNVKPYGPPAPEREEKELLPHSLQPEYT